MPEQFPECNMRSYRNSFKVNSFKMIQFLNQPLKKNKIENIQYKACITITGAIQGTSREHLYHELSLESLGDRRWYRKLTFFIKL